MIASQPTLDSAVLRLAKERNEARELVRRLAYALDDTGSQVRYDALLEAVRAVKRWKEGE